MLSHRQLQDHVKHQGLRLRFLIYISELASENKYVLKYLLLYESMALLHNIYIS